MEGAHGPQQVCGPLSRRSAGAHHQTLAPLDAVFFEAAKPFVFLQTSSGWHRREIELGLRNHVAAVVRAGVSPGDVVALERAASGRPPS
jgi:hypothetical protein